MSALRLQLHELLSNCIKQELPYNLKTQEQPLIQQSVSHVHHHYHLMSHSHGLTMEHLLVDQQQLVTLVY